MLKNARPRGTSYMEWMDSVKRILYARGMPMEQGIVVMCDSS